MNEKTQATYLKLQTVLLAGILLLLLVGGILLASQISRVSACIDTVDEQLQAIEVEEVNDAVSALTEAANRLAQIDTDTLNQTAQSLKEAADTLKQVDMTALNGLVTSLQNVTAKLQTAVNAISSLFGR